MYYAGETYDNGEFEASSLKLSDIDLNWSKREEFESIMLPIIMSDNLELHIYKNEKCKKYELFVMSTNESEYLSFDIFYTKNNRFHSAIFQDILIGDIRLSKSSRLNSKDMLRVLVNYHSTGKVKF